MLPEVTLSCLIISAFVCGANCHGFLWEPPARGVSYLAGYDTESNYNHMGLNCGGFANQWLTHNGQCGVCGDDYGQAQPRDNEAGGKYALANRTVTGSYVMGGTLRVEVNLTAYHKGFFTFRLCSNNDFSSPVTKSCLDELVLPQVGTTDTEYEISTNTHYEVLLQLPANLTCSQCVLQWNYTTGNSWNNWPGEEACVGCGPHETFINCADIEILDSTSSGSSTPFASSTSIAQSSTTSTSPTPSASTPSSTSPTSSGTTPSSTSPTSSATTPSSTLPTSSATTPSSTSPTTSSTFSSSSSSGQMCTSICSDVANICDCDVNPAYEAVVGMKTWCIDNCKMGYCPASHCSVCYC